MSNEKPFSNPLQRLHYIVDVVQRAGTSNEEQAWKVWYRALQADAEVVFLRRFTKVCELNEESVSMVQSVGLGELHQRWVEPVAKLLRVEFLNLEWRNSKLPTDSIQALEFAADAMKHHASTETFIAAAERNKLREEADALLRDVVDSSLDHELKAFLVAQLFNILEALRVYPIAGAKELQRATEAAAGALMLQGPRLAEQAKNDPTARSFLLRFVDVATHISTLVTLANGLGELTTKVRELLSWISS